MPSTSSEGDDGMQNTVPLPRLNKQFPRFVSEHNLALYWRRPGLVPQAAGFPVPLLETCADARQGIRNRPPGNLRHEIGWVFHTSSFTFKVLGPIVPQFVIDKETFWRGKCRRIQSKFGRWTTSPTIELFLNTSWNWIENIAASKITFSAWWWNPIRRRENGNSLQRPWHCVYACNLVWKVILGTPSFGVFKSGKKSFYTHKKKVVILLVVCEIQSF